MCASPAHSRLQRGSQQNVDASPGFEAALHASCAAHLFRCLTRNPVRLLQRSCRGEQSGMATACCHIDDALLHVLPRHIHPAHNPHEGVSTTSCQHHEMTGRIAAHAWLHRKAVLLKALHIDHADLVLRPLIPEPWPRVTARMFTQGPRSLPVSTSMYCPATGAV